MARQPLVLIQGSSLPDSKPPLGSKLEPLQTLGGSARVVTAVAVKHQFVVAWAGRCVAGNSVPMSGAVPVPSGSVLAYLTLGMAGGTLAKRRSRGLRP